MTNNCTIKSKVDRGLVFPRTSKLLTTIDLNILVIFLVMVDFVELLHKVPI